MRVEPLTIGCANSVSMLGLSWTAARRLARELGVRELRVSERKVLLPARELLDALRQRSERAAAAAAPPALEQTDEQIEAAFLAELGLEAVAAIGEAAE